MKLSKMPTEQARLAFCDLLPHVNAIVADDVFREKLEQMKNVGDSLRTTSVVQMIVFGMKVISEIVPYLLMTKADDIYAILSIVSGKPVDEIKEQPLDSTIKEARESLYDKDLIALFT